MRTIKIISILAGLSALSGCTADVYTTRPAYYTSYHRIHHYPHYRPYYYPSVTVENNRIHHDPVPVPVPVPQPIPAPERRIHHDPIPVPVPAPAPAPERRIHHDPIPGPAPFPSMPAPANNLPSVTVQ